MMETTIKKRSYLGNRLESLQMCKPLATIRTKFHPSTMENRKGRLYYQVICGKTTRQIKSEFQLKVTEWEELNNKTLHKYSTANITPIHRAIDREIKQLENLARRLEKEGRCSAEAIVEAFECRCNEASFEHFMEGVIIQLSHLGRYRTSETYTSTLRSFRRFRGRRLTSFELFDSDLMMEYEAWLRQHGVTMNTVSFYMRILRATHNRAVERGLTTQNMPFRHVYTGIDKTTKRALSLQTIKRIKELNLSDRPNEQLARDLFLFSFYTRGMSFVDMAYLHKENLKNGVLAYCRRKTGQRLTIKWEACMQTIVDRHATQSTEYLLPIIQHPGNERHQYLNKLRLTNSLLKQVGARVGLPISLTLYCARHSWASAAQSKNVPIAVISEGMGHDSQSTTQIYLASLDNTLIDRANQMILKNL